MNEEEIEASATALIKYAAFELKIPPADMVSVFDYAMEMAEHFLVENYYNQNNGQKLMNNDDRGGYCG